MSIFDNILGTLGFASDKAENVVAPATTAAPKPAAVAPATTAAPKPAAVAPAATPTATVSAPAPAAKSKAVSEIDVLSKLEQLAANHPEDLNWKSSIVDLLKLLKIDSSLAARKELATELGCPTGKMGDSAQMNIWLHKTVLQRIAANGGNIPADLLD